MFPEAFLPDSSLMLCYGDYDANTGPMDIVSISPTGVPTTHLTGWDNEQVYGWRRLNDGVLWTPSIDPKSNTFATLVTNLGGSFHVIPVHVEGKLDLVHLFDVAQDPGGRLYICGARQDDVAVVWQSDDNGVTWSEALASTVHQGTDANRFYEFKRDLQGRFVVTVTYFGGSYTLTDGAWVYSADEPTIQPPDLDVWITQVYPTDGRTPPYCHVNRRGQGVAFDLPGFAHTWVCGMAPDGAIWLSDRSTIYRVPPE